MMNRNKIKGRAGKQYLVDHIATDLCAECPFFRSCWSTEEYDLKKSVDKENGSV